MPHPGYGGGEGCGGASDLYYRFDPSCRRNTTRMRLPHRRRGHRGPGRSGPRRARRLGARSRGLALRSGDRLPVLARATRQSSDGTRAREIRGFADLKRFGAVRGRVAARRTGAALGAARPRRQAGLRLRDRAARPASRRRASPATTSASTTSCSARRCPTSTFPRGSNWLMLGPSGPRRLRLAVEHLAQYRGGICFCVDLDPRWVIKLIKKGWSEHLQAYKDHVIDQAVTILPGEPRHPLHVHDAEAARGAGAAARVDGHDDPQGRASPASSPAAPSSRRSGTASRTRSCSTART